MTRSDLASVIEPPIPRIIPDANVFLNGITGRPNTLNRRLYQNFRRGLNRFVFSESWLTEFERILEYPDVIALGLTPSLVAKVTHDLWLLGEYVNLVPLYDWPGVGDRKDWFLFDLLLESNADALVTQDRRLLEAGKKLKLPVFNPSELPALGLISPR
jgi:predicted nucleic acid-binding protein